MKLLFIIPVKVMRIICLITAYLSLLSSLVDIVCHVVIVGKVTDSFQCDVNPAALRDFNCKTLEAILLVNVGTFGSNPYPAIITFRHILENSSEVNRCYYGMLHISIAYFVINIINMLWLQIVQWFVRAVRKGEPKKMLVFLLLTVVKIVLQEIYLTNGTPPYPTLLTAEENWQINLPNIGINVVMLMCVSSWIKYLWLKNDQEASATIDQPPSYKEWMGVQT